MKIPLSVIILTPEKISPLLRKVQRSVDFADQVLVVETGKEAIDDFAHIRNQVIQQAKHDWVFFLDSDEVVASKDIEEIESIISCHSYDLVRVNRSDIFLDKQLRWGEWGKAKLIRMGRKSHLKFIRPVHEVALIDEDSRIFNSQIKLTHYSHPDLASFFAKISYYSLLEANYRDRNGYITTLFQLVFFPPLKFIYNYCLLLGFLDGWRGFVYALMMSLHSLFVRIFQFESSLPLKSSR